MPTTPPANLGYGNQSEVSIDHFNQYMRSSPWYQQLIASFGQDPRNVHLNDSQKQAVIRAAQANGAVIDEGKQEVDDSGNFRNEGHKLRNTLIVAGLAAATIATMGAAGAFTGPAAASLGAVEGGGYGIGAGTVAALGTGAMGAVPVAASLGTAGAVGAAAGSAGTLGSTVGVAAPAVSTGGKVASAFGVGNNLNTYANLAGTAGSIFSNIYGASKSADANTRAAELADEASKRAEQFSREQAEGGWQSNEHTQHANYDQWRARQDAIMGSLGHQLGINYTAPEYSPGIDPRYTGGPASPTGSTTNAADPAQAFIANWQRTHDPKEGIAPLAKAYKAAGFGDRFLVNGTTPSNNELVVGGQKFKVLSAENGPNPQWYIPGTDDSGGAPPVARQTLATFVRPNFMPLPTPYQPGTLGAYVGN